MNKRNEHQEERAFRNALHAYKLYTTYKETIDSLFETIIGQLGREIRNNLKGMEEWTEIDDSNDTLLLLTKLRDLCYADNNNKIHPVDDLIRKLLKLLQSRQNEKAAALFVEETTNKSDVVKSAGGQIISAAVIKYAISKLNESATTKITYQDYQDMCSSPDADKVRNKKAIDEAVRQIVLAHTLIQGSNDKMHQGLRVELEKDYAKGHDNYPTTATEALDLLNRYKSKSNRPPRQPREDTKNEEKNEDKIKEEEGRQLTTIGEPCSALPSSTAQELEEAHQLLMTATDDDKTKHDTNYGPDKEGLNQDELMFIQIAEEDKTEHNVLVTANKSTIQHNELKPHGMNATQYVDETYVTRGAWCFREKSSSPTFKARYEPEYDCFVRKYGATTPQDANGLPLKHRSGERWKDALHGIGDNKDQPLYMDISNAHVFAQAHGGQVDPSWILLDSQASCNVLCNLQLVRNVRKHPGGNRMTIHCNAGSMTIDTVADFPGFGMVWFHMKCIANCLSLALVSDRYRVTLDTAEEQAFVVHKANGETRKFHRAKCDLYVCDLREQNKHIMVTTIAGQKKSFSRRDIRRAERANKLQEILMYPSNKAFAEMVTNNMINNCNVTRRDIFLGREIFGINPNIIKGKSTRQQPGHTREDHLAVPPAILKNYSKVTLVIDVYHINGIKFMRSISRHLMFRITKPIRNAKENTLFDTVKQMVGVYKSRGFNVVQVYGDNEFTCIQAKLEHDLNIKFFPVARGAHEPFIERDGRTSKERCRCVFSGLPFVKWPPRMIMELPIAVDFYLNYWCSSGGVSATVPPRQIMYGIKLDARVHCQHQFGDYVLSHEDSDNTMKPRARDAIFLRPTGNPDGGFYVFDLVTARRVHRMRATPAHMTDTIINRVHKIASDQEAPEGINFGGFDGTATIMDIDDNEPAAEDEDDDASDATYSSSDDDTVETELTQAESDDDDDELNYRHEDIDNIQEVDERDVDDHEIEPEEVTGDPNVEQDNEDGTATQDEEEPQAQRTLRPRVQSHQYDESEGYVTSSRSRNQDGTSLFCHGYSNAVKQLERDSEAILLVGAAIERYNSMEALLVTPQYGIRKGLKIFGKDGSAAVLKELKQLHELQVISPIHPRTLSKEEIYRALPYLMFLKRKRCGRVKGRGCADGRSQRESISKDEESSPTASITAIMMTCLIDAIEERVVGIVDIPGAFLQCDMPAGDVTHIKLVGAMADLLIKIDPKLYQPCAVKNKKGETVLYTKANKAIYGTLKAAVIFWTKLKNHLEKSFGFKPNPYDPCTVNKDIDGATATIQWYVDDVKISHRDKSVVAKLIKDLNEEFGKIAPLTGSIDTVHEYLGMTIDYRTKGVVKFSMFDYLHDIIDGLPEHLKTNCNTTSPAANHLFEVNPEAKKLSEDQADEFHHYVAKLLFAAKRARPDLQTAVAFLCTRVSCPDEDDLKKLVRVLGYTAGTIFLPLVIGWDESGNIYWYVDASFAVHNDMRSHTGGMMTFGRGGVLCVSTKQKINTKSSTEAELVGVDDTLPHNLWCLHFLRAQGYKSVTGKNTELPPLLGRNNILYQDNTSAIRLESNGKSSSTKRTRHIAIRYFMIVDYVKHRKEISIVHCPTENMISDYFTKPLQGAQFRKLRNSVLGITEEEYLKYKLEYEAVKNGK